MKVCKNCKSVFQDNSSVICPRCNTILDNSYSLYDKNDLVKDISADSKTLWNISWRVFIMLFSILGIIGVITGLNIYSYFNTLNDKINQKISEEFEKPNITATVKKVAKENADELIIEQIKPEVERFNEELTILKVKTDSVIENKTKQFERNIDFKTSTIDKKMVELDKSLNRIEQSKNEILKIEREMLEIKELAMPPTLKFRALGTKEIAEGLKITIQFEPSKNEPLGRIIFKVSLINSIEQMQKIYTEASFGAFTGSREGKISNDKKTGRFEYALITSGYPTIIIEISEKSDLKIEGNYLDEPIYIRKEQY